MARTIRRKSFNKKGARRRYWAEDWYTHEDVYHCGSYQTISVKKEGKAFRKGWWKYHGDNGRNEYSPSRWYRQNREGELRSFNKEELLRFQQDPDYETMCMSDPKSHYWDWS